MVICLQIFRILEKKVVSGFNKLNKFLDLLILKASNNFPLNSRGFNLRWKSRISNQRLQSVLNSNSILLLSKELLEKTSQL